MRSRTPIKPLPHPQQYPQDPGKSLRPQLLECSQSRATQVGAAYGLLPNDCLLVGVPMEQCSRMPFGNSMTRLTFTLGPKFGEIGVILTSVVIAAKLCHGLGPSRRSPGEGGTRRPGSLLLHLLWRDPEPVGALRPSAPGGGQCVRLPGSQRRRYRADDGKIHIRPGGRAPLRVASLP